MPAEFTAVITATAHWLVRAYPPAEGALSSTLAEAQARQAVTVAAWLRYPTTLDAGLVGLLGPGGSARLDWLVGSHLAEPDEAADHGWRSWVDETVASWAACLLTDAALALGAVSAVTAGEHARGQPCEFRRLTAPTPRDRRAAPLLRHPDLLAPIADLHRAALLARL